MDRFFKLLAVLPLAFLAACAHQAMDAQAVLRNAEQAMGGANLKTLRYAGSGIGATFGQAWVPGQAWPRLNLSGSRFVDYENGALREESARSRAEVNGGGALP